MKRILTILSFIYVLVRFNGQTNVYYYLFKWHWEPNEKAFKILLPQNWISKGGIFRIDPNTGGGAANALDAKLDFIVNNKLKTASVRWSPDLFYFIPGGKLNHFEYKRPSKKTMICLNHEIFETI